MGTAWSQIVRFAAAALLVTPVALPAQTPEYKVRVESDLVLVHVTALDRRGNLVRDLARQEFVLLEDGRRQVINSIDYEVPLPAAAPPADLPLLTSGTPINPRLTQGLRLVILFFDFTSLEPDQAMRALRAANSYVKDMPAIDRVAVVTLADSLKVQQDFTSDRDLLNTALANIRNLSMAGEDSSTETQPYDLFSNDRRLRALQDVAKALQLVPQKKTLIFFAGSVGGSVQNEPQLAGTVEAAARSNLRVYAVDARGLSAAPALGDASVASAAGTAVLSGQAVVAQIGLRFQSQELLRALAKTTSGQLFSNDNDLREPFRRLTADQGEYYVLSYRSSNRAHDGRFRRITVRSTRRDIKLEHRAGYYARREWKAVPKEEREQQLEDELVADLPTTDLPVYVWTAYLRVDREHYFVPVVVLVPGNELGSSATQSPRLDVVARVRDEQGRDIAEIRDNVPFDSHIQSKYLQYTSGATVRQGNYRIRVVVRDNSTGRIGCFESAVQLPAGDGGFHLSPVLIGQRTLHENNHSTPLASGNQELIPNPTGILPAGEDVFLRSEVYAGGSDAGAIVASIRLLRGTTLVYDSGPLPGTYVAKTGAVVIERSIPKSELHSGTYMCQLTVVDEKLGVYSLARLPLTIVARQ